MKHLSLNSSQQEQHCVFMTNRICVPMINEIYWKNDTPHICGYNIVLVGTVWVPVMLYRVRNMSYIITVATAINISLPPLPILPSSLSQYCFHFL